MPLSVKDGMGAWISDFQKSDAPQFKGKSDKERREMAIAAYLSAKRGDKKESVEENVGAPRTAAHRRAQMGPRYSDLQKKDDKPPFTPDPKKPQAKNSDDTVTSPMSRARQLAKMARDKGVKKESTDAYGKSMDAIANKRKTDAMTSSDKDKLGKLADMMAKEKKPKKEAYRPPTQAEIDADKRKENRGKSRPSMTAKSATRNVYKNYMGGLKKESVEIEEKYSWNDVNKALTKANYMRGNPAEISKIAKHFDHKSGNDKKFSHADVKKNLSKAGIDAARHHNVMKHMKESTQLDEAKYGFFGTDNPKIGDAVKHSNGASGKVKKIETQGNETWVHFKDKNGKMNFGQWKKSVTPMKESVDLYEAMAQERFQSAEAELIKYAKAHGGMDKNDFLQVAKMLGQIGRLNILQAGQVLSRLNRKLSNMDTDPRDKVYSILKQKGLMEAVQENIEEKAQFKVDIEGMPSVFIQGSSSAEILSKLRKIVKQPSMIKGVERHTDVEVRKAYRQKAQGRSMDEAKSPNPENNEPASPDEKSMAIKQAEFIGYVSKEIASHLKNNKEFPEWMQNKLSALHQKSKDMHSTLGAHGTDDMDESTDVNEISADLAKNYYKKATAPGATKSASDMGHTKDSMRKTHNRVVGSNRALDRMFRRDKTYKK